MCWTQIPTIARSPPRNNHRCWRIYKPTIPKMCVHHGVRKMWHLQTLQRNNAHLSLGRQNLDHWSTDSLKAYITLPTAHDHYAQWTAKCHIRAKAPTTSKNYHSLLNTHSTVQNWRHLGTWSWINQKADTRQIQALKAGTACTAFFRLQGLKREPLMAVAFHHGGPLITASAVPHRGRGNRFEHLHLADVVPNCLVAFYDKRVHLPHTPRETLCWNVP